MNVEVNNEDFITTVKTNAKHLDGYKFTYDNKLDILRVWASTDFKETEIESLADNVFVTKENGKIVFIKILDFMESFDFLNTYLPKDINDYLLSARSLIISLKNENTLETSEEKMKVVEGCNFGSLTDSMTINGDYERTISKNDDLIDLIESMEEYISDVQELAHCTDKYSEIKKVSNIMKDVINDFKQEQEIESGQGK